MYLHQELIIDSLNHLRTVHQFFCISFLVFKQADLPIGEQAEIPINQLEEDFLSKYFRPEPSSRWYFRTGRVADKNKYWLAPKYPSSGLQAIRTQRFKDVFIHSSNTNLWGWGENYIRVLKEKKEFSPIPAFALAVWLYRDRTWSSNTKENDIIEIFLQEFKITKQEEKHLFDTTLPKQGDLLSEIPYSWTHITEILHIPPPIDLPVNEGGTLSILEIDGVGPAKKLRIDLAERVNLLTGDNGLGKSFLLDCAWWALSGNWSAYPAYPREDATRREPKIAFQIQDVTGKGNKGESVFNWEKQEWAALRDRPTIPGLLIYARVDGAFAIWDPARDYWREGEDTRSTKPLVFTREEIWDGLQDDDLGGKKTYLSNGLMADWIHWQNSPEKQPFETFKQVLKRLSPPDCESGDLGQLEPGKPTRIPRDSRWIPTIKHSYGEIPLLYASAGVKRIVALAYLIVWAWEEHKAQSRLIRRDPQRRMVVLVDEIEAHLHPKWQRIILPALLDARNELDPELKIQLLVATHSPLVMASIEPIFDTKKDKIFHLDIKGSGGESEVDIREPDFVVYGTIDSWLKSDIFELGQARSVEAEQAYEDAKTLMGRSTAKQSEVREVSERLMKLISSHDPFWPKWTYFAGQHGVDL